MSRPLLPVPHRTEAFAGACLPACCQMALALWSISESQSEIAAQIGHIEGAGTAARNITRLTALGVSGRLFNAHFYGLERDELVYILDAFAC